MMESPPPTPHGGAARSPPETLGFGQSATGQHAGRMGSYVWLPNRVQVSYCSCQLRSGNTPADVGAQLIAEIRILCRAAT
jgi:hypothetical protein